MGSLNAPGTTGEDVIRPFSLLGTAGSKVREDIATQYGYGIDSIEDAYPCTPIQEGLLSLTSKQAGDYVMDATFELADNLSLTTFCAAWDDAVNRAPILRTRIVYHATLGMLQVVLRERIRWNRKEDETTGAIGELGRELTRYTIEQQPGGKRLFHWKIHHAVYDGWSLSQITATVNSACGGRELLSFPAEGFNRFVQYVQSQDSSEARRYWERALGGSELHHFPPVVSASQHVSTHKTEVRFPTPVTRLQGITRTTLISAAWAIVIAEHTSSRDVVFGSTVSGRDAKIQGIKNIAGPTIAMVPVRAQVDRAGRARALLESLQRDSNERKPFEHLGIQAIADMNDDTQRACAFQTAVVVQPVDNDLCSDAAVGQWLTGSKDQIVGTYGLTLQVYLGERDIRVEATFYPDAVDEWEVLLLLRRMGQVVGQLAECSQTDERTVGEIETMTGGERNQIYAWNETVPRAETRTLHEMVREAAEQNPDAPAVCAWDGKLTYAELEARSKSLASHLRAVSRVRPDVYIPLCFEKSVWAVVAMLGVLKAGGAFVSLDPSQSARRRDSLLDEVGAEMVLISEKYAGTTFGKAQTAVVGPHSFAQWERPVSASLATPPTTPPTLGSAAYLIFTSGSTGRPKGVTIEHRSVSTSCRYNGAVMGFTAATRTYQFASYTFDASIQEIFTTLIHGGCVCVPSDEERLGDIGESMRLFDVNLTLLTPSAARLIRPSTVPKLKTVVMGGEMMTDTDRQQWSTRNMSLVVTYGPSECAISCVTGRLDDAREAARGYIGSAVGCSTWIVDPQDHDRLMPLGAVGELVIEGPIVGRGYLGDLKTTAEAFLEHVPWLARAGRRGRVYKTGDLVRYDCRGSLVFMGRKDTQVKVRGQRVELGEIEKHLRDCLPDVPELAVEVVVPREASNAILALFLARGDHDDSKKSMDSNVRITSLPTEAESYLSDRLPAYMIPEVCFYLSALPKKESFKMDRSKLREMGSSFSAQQLAEQMTGCCSGKRQPATELEEMLQHIWARVLNIRPETVGMDDSFLRLGGDSITAMQVSSVARSRQLNISTVDVLRKKTIASLLKDVKLTAARKAPSAAHPSGGLWRLGPMQKLYLDLQPDVSVCFDQCFLLRITRPVSPASVQDAVAAIIDRHPILRSRFSPDGKGGLEQRVHQTGDDLLYKFRHVEDTGPGQDPTRLITETRESLDIERGPLVAAALFDSADGQSLFITVHHLVVDLVSWRILLQDLEEWLTSGSLSSIPTMSFQTWCDLADTYVSQLPESVLPPVELSPPLLDYWGLDAADNVWGANTCQNFQLDRQTTEWLTGPCNDALQTQPVELLVSMLIHSFGQAFGDRSLPPILCEGHGREPWDSDLDLSRTVGWFTTMFPVQLRGSPDRSLLDTIRETKDCIRRFSSHGWTYFASQFRSKTTRKEFLSQFPAEIAFNYVGAYQQLERDDGLFEICTLPDTDPASSGCMRRISLFDISVAVQHGCLDVTFRYPKTIQRQTDISAWLQQYRSSLTQASTLLAESPTLWTLSDFPMAFTSYGDLDRYHGSLASPGDVEDIFPCSPMQQGILVAQEKCPSNYRVALLVEVHPCQPGAVVDQSRLRRAWSMVVKRHSLLRAVISDAIPGSSGPMHIVFKNPEPGVTLVEDNTSVESVGTVEAFCGRHGLHTYDQEGLQHHVTICQNGPSKAYFHLEMNHAISDGHSQMVLLRDLQSAYTGSLDSEAPSYRDFVSYLAEEHDDEARDYWTHYLTGAEPSYFPTLREGSSEGHEHGHGTVHVPDIDTDMILAFCSEWEVTPAALIQATWALVLSRYSGSAWPCFGNLASGRDLPIDGVDEMVGPLIGMLTCLVDLAVPRTVLELLRAIQEDTLQSLAHQTYPLASVQGEQNLGGLALFNSGVSFRHDAREERDSAIRFEFVDQLDSTEARHTANQQYDIHVNASLSGTRLDMTMRYSHRVMTSQQAMRVAESLSVALTALASRPHESVQAIDILGPSDRQQLWRWNAAVPKSLERAVPDLIHDQTMLRPEAPAVDAWDGSLTYAELDGLTTRLACHLRSSGISRGSLVPLCFEKSMWAVVAILGVLKAGAAFVPIDPSQAPRRRQGLVEQTGAVLVLTSSAYADMNFGPNCVTVNVGPQSVLSWEASTSIKSPHPAAIAYVIFTSGSTGEPKGVVIEQRSVGTSCWYHGGRVGFNASSRVLQFAAYTFDASLMDILTTLIYGGCICIPCEDDRLADMARTIRDMNVNLAFLTPSTARLMEPADVPGLQTLILGGERVTNSDYVRWNDGRSLRNGYGPTECSIGCMVNDMDASTVDQGCIGKAVGSVSWIVDPADHGRLCPIGVVGELLIEGPIVGQGYYGRPDKTAEVFIQDPAWLLQGLPGQSGRRGRLYKTGDLVRYNENGNVSFVGRKDNQIKIHGQRVELGEIEHQVRQCMDAHQLAVEVVVPVGQDSGDVILAAFFEMAGSSDPIETDVAGLSLLSAETDMLDQLARHLPDYMVPTVYWRLDRMPMTTSGKIDRRRLREMAAPFSRQKISELRSSSTGSRPARRQPATAGVEARLQHLWAEVLHIRPDQIGLDDSFFLLGGQSIAAMRLVALARQAGLSFTVADVFRHPRLHSLAGVVVAQTAETATPERTGQALDDLQPFGLLRAVDALQCRADVAASLGLDEAAIEDMYPCTALQEGLMALSIKTPGDYILQKVLHLGDVDLSAFVAAWKTTVLATPILRTRIVQHSQAGLVQVVVKKEAEWTEASSLAAYLEADQKLPMGTGQPLVRFALVGNGNTPTSFVWTIHHALYDGWSMPRLLQMVEQAYHGAVPQPTGFNEFIRYLADSSQESADIYWTGVFADRELDVFPAVSSLVQDSKADTTVEHVFSLHDRDRSQNATVSTLVRAAWAVVLHHHTGATDVVFGAVVSGRSAPVVGIDDVIGPTIATVPIAVAVRPEQSVAAYLDGVQDASAQMIPYEQTGLHNIAKLSPSAQRGCEFQTLLVVQPADEEAEAAEKAGRFGEWELVSGAESFSSYPLTLSCSSDGGRLTLTATFDSEVVQPWLMKRLLADLEFAMQQLASSTTPKTLADLVALTPAALQEIWTSSSSVPPVDRCVHDLVDEQLLRYPQALAVDGWDGQLTNAELQEQSTQLAAYLQSKGVGPETFVPLFFEKSIWTTVAVLAVLKAGGAFVPFDPARTDQQRQQLLLDRIQAPVVLTSAQYTGSLAMSDSIIVGPGEMSRWTACASPIAAALPTPSSAAVMLFTSGSTGEPKGVVIEHRAVSSSCWFHGAKAGFGRCSRTLQFAAHTFDTIIMEILTTLLYGGCVCVPSEKGRLEDLEASIASLRANITFLTPSVARLVDPARVPTLQTLILGGERVSEEDAQRWMRRPSPIRLLNGYGPTECTVFSAMDDIEPDSGGAIAIGRPVGCVGWVVDAQDYQKLLPIGAVGELLIEGPNVGREYLHAPDRTEAAFVTDPEWLLRGAPSSGIPGRHGRLYRTGDLVRRSEDGKLWFVGRRDGQVKVHGQRVEVGEIEHHLRACLQEDVDAVAVEIIVPEGDIQGVVAAFLSTKKADEKDEEDGEVRVMTISSELKDQLSERLPRYMMPSVYFSLGTMPTTTSCKIDRHRLRQLGSAFSSRQVAEARSSGSHKRPPTTAIQRQLREVWARLFRIDATSIGLDDDFFLLGGDSIVAMKLVAEARAVGLGLSVANIFGHARLEQLSEVAVPAASETEEEEQELAPFSLIQDHTDVPAACADLARCLNIDPTQIEDVYPCTALQGGLISLTARQPGAYVMRKVWDVSPDIDMDAFCRAWETLVQLAPILRTRIAQHPDLGLVQVVVRGGIQWIESDSLESYLARDQWLSIGLGQPLTAYALVSDSAGRQRQFVWSIHHALYDGWSMPRMMKMLHDAYLGRPLARPPSFGRFVKHITTADGGDGARMYWEGLFSGLEPSIFPSTLAAHHEPRGDSVCRLTCQSPRAAGSTTVSTLIRAAWALVVHQHTLASDVVFGATVTGRVAPVVGIEDMVGPTVATVPLAIRVDAMQTVADYLAGVQSLAVSMIPYEQTGLQRIARYSEDTQSCCQFQTLVVIQPVEEDGVDDVETDGQSDFIGRWSPASDDASFLSYGLVLQVEPGRHSTTISAAFDSSMIEPWLMDRLLHRLDDMIHRLDRAGSGELLAQMDTPTASDLDQIWAWNQSCPVPADRCVHDLIADRVSLHPNTLAVSAWDGDLTYAELDMFSSRLARHLVQLGAAGADVLVPLCFEKSQWAVVAMLAVLKAGAAFVLLDTSLPESRRRAIVDQKRCGVLLCSEEQAVTCSSLVETTVVVSSDFSCHPSDSLEKYGTGNPLSMYVVFTSGSTGTPKGVVVTHGAFSSAIQFQAEQLGYRASTRTFDFSSYAFDLSIESTFFTLATGGCLCIPSEADRKNNLTGALVASRASLVHLTPSVARLLDRQALVDLQFLLLGGESARDDDLSGWPAATKVLVTYGPSECTPTTTIQTVSPNEGRGTATNIGFGTGAVTWVVDPDDHDRLRPIGAVGELLLEGPIVGRGSLYLHDPAKTAAALVHDPAWLVSGTAGRPGRSGTLYRTGDLVRYDHDGSLVFVGRRDTQVKIRGQRVELGEVEHHLRVCFAEARQVLAEVVILEEKPTLVAFIVSAEEEEEEEEEGEKKPIVLSSEDESHYLRQHLPASMVPAVYLTLRDRLPINLSGKTDRLKVRQLGASILSAQTLVDMASADKETGKRPLTPTEQALQSLWARILRLDESSISPKDHFFHLGGDSIAAMQLVADARRAAMALSVADVFHSPLLCDMARLLAPATPVDTSRPEPFSLLSRDLTCTSRLAAACNVDPAAIDDAYPCTPLQEGLLSLTSKASHAYNAYTARIILDLAESLDVGLFCRAWEEVVRRLPILRTRIFQDPQLGLVQLVLNESIIWARGTDLKEYCRQDDAQLMAPGSPLSRYALVAGKFVWTIHHALYDGHILGQITTLVSQVYKGVALSPLTDFVFFVRHLQEADADAIDTYWRSALHSYDSQPFPAPVQSNSSATTSTAADCVRRQVHILPTNDVTQASLVRAAVALTLSGSSGSDDVIFGETLSGRQADLDGIEQIAGPTIATVPVRVSLRDAASVSVAAFLRRVQQQSVDLIPYQQAGLQHIRTLSSDAARACAFQTLLVIQPRDMESIGDKDFGTWTTDRDMTAFAAYPLNLFCMINDDGAWFEAVFDATVISKWMVESVLDRLGDVLGQLSSPAMAGHVLSDIDLVSRKEYERIWSWNGSVPDATDKCAHSMVEEQARQQPAAIAVSGWDGRFTYAQLDEQATILAEHLVRLGSGSLVPLCFEKSTWTVVAMLAVLKAGGSIVPLDPSQSSDRRERIVAQTGARLVVASEQYATLMARPGRIVVALCEQTMQSLRRERPVEPVVLPPVDSRQGAYVMFTSGSTGQPKGVMVDHRANSTSCVSNARIMNMGPHTRTLQFSAHTFDVCILEVFGTLAHGGCICVPSDSQRVNDLEGFIHDEQVNLAILTPTVSRLLEPGRVPSMRTMVLGGETCDDETFARWTPQASVFNGYGPTECTMCSLHDFNQHMMPHGYCIGTAVGSVFWVVVLGDVSRLAPIGTVGELVIEGPVLSTGYLNEPAKTAAAFIEDPPWLLQGLPRDPEHAGRPGRRGRLYKTGDMVRYNNDGSVVYLGRHDTQVKIRGQRLELGEVEYHVQACLPNVRQVVAEVITPSEGVPTLAVFLAQSETGAETPESGVQLTRVSASVDAYLADQLPAYMVPSVYFSIDTLPMSSAGKTDRRRLREIGASFSVRELTNHGGSRSRRPPSTPEELALQTIWARILQIDPDSIGADDSFLRLGGDSIAAMKLVAEARTVHIALSVADIFRSPQLSAMAHLSRAISVREAGTVRPFSLLAGDVGSLRPRMAAVCGVVPEAVEDAYPSTPLQQGLLSLTSQSATAYTARAILALSDVDLDRFRQTWEQIAQKLPILRTRIMQDSQLGLVQVVVDEQIEWRGGSLDEYLRQDADEPMGLGRRLSRYAIVSGQTTDQPASYFVWTLHHALYDGHFLNRVAILAQQIYQNLPQLSFQDFRYFASHLSSLDADSGRQFWQSQLDSYDAEPFPVLPAGHDTVRAGSTATRRIRLPPVHSADVTTSSLIRAAWALTLSGSSGSDDIVYGATVSGRQADVVGIEAMAGPTIATVPLRIRTTATLTVSEFLSSVQSQAIDMIPFEQAGLQHIREMSDGARHACQFQTLLVIQPPQETDLAMADDSFGTWSSDRDLTSFATYALNLVCVLDGAHVAIEAVFDAAVMDTWMVEMMLERLENLLRQLTSAAPDSSLADMDVLSDSDYRRIWSLNKTVPEAVERCVHDLFAKQVSSRPHAPAVSAWDGELTYAELDEQSTRLAQFLTSKSLVGSGSMVPLCFEKTKWAVVSLLAVLKAGGAFVPMSASSQASGRREQVLDQVHARVILASVNEARLLSQVPGREVIAVGPEMLASLPAEGPVPAPGEPSSPAYVLFTSGSTGRPKGVVVEHRALATSCLSHGRALGLDTHTRMLQFTSYTFDVSLMEMLTTLVFGGCLCVPSDQDRFDRLEQSVRELEANVASLTPSVARLLDPGRVPLLETIILAGENATDDDFDRWPSTLKKVNAYGPTECTIFCSLNTLSGRGGSRIGKAVGSVAWVVAPSDHGRLVPFGAVGELLVEGPLLAKCYLDEPEMTAASFIRDPAWLLRGIPGHQTGRSGRLYKTGDLVRYDSHGSLVYVGRLDAQVKIRGQRVELGEVEHHVFASVPGAKQVVAEMIQLGGDGDPLLAAFVSMESEAQEKTSDGMLSEWLPDRLPEWPPVRVLVVSPDVENDLSERLAAYMVPRAFFALGRIPMNSSGKVDRHMLRRIGSGLTAQKLSEIQSNSPSPKRTPSTEAERLLQQIWAHTLNVDLDTVGIDDSFFRLGGDSITAMQVSAAARSHQMDISTADILQKKTISRLAAHGSTASRRSDTQYPTDADEDDGQPFQLSPMQLLHTEIQPDPTRCFDQNFHLKLRQPLPFSAIEEAIHTVVSRHPMLRARFSQTGSGEWQQRISRDVSGSCHIRHVTDGSDKAASIRHCRELLDITNGPLIASVVFQETQDQSLFITAHHLVIDLVSWRVLFQELEDLLTAGPADPLPTNSFRVWCELQTQFAASISCPRPIMPHVSDTQINYWGIESSDNVVGATSTLQFSLDEATSAALLGDCNEAFGTRPVELMIAALSHSFRSVFTDRSTPAIYSEGHGRESWDDRIDVSRTVGWFTTMFPVHAAPQVDETGTGTVADTIRHTKDVFRSLPKNGWSHFTSRFAHRDKAADNARDFPVEVLLNYAGSYQQLERPDSLFEPTATPDGCEPASQSGLGRYALFDVLAHADRGRLAVTLVYPGRAHHQEKIGAWMNQFQSLMGEMAADLPRQPREWTLSDFPAAFSSYDDLAKFQTLLRQLCQVGPDDVQDIHACTPIQQSILAAQKRHPEMYRAVLNLEVVSPHGGPVDLAKIKQAWRTVVRQHSLLRARLVEDMAKSHRTMVVVLKDPAAAIRSYNERDVVRNADRDTSYDADGLQHCLSIDTETGAADCIRLRLEINHAIMDGHSLAVLLRDFRQAYHGGGIGSQTAPAYRVFSDYVDAQLSSADKEFWPAYLESVVSPCHFPVISDSHRDEGTFTITLSSIDTDAIRILCAKEELTAATVLKVAWALVLQTLTGSDVPCFGVLTSGRDAPIDGAGDIIGPLMSLIPCRVPLAEPQSALKVLRRVQEDYARCLAHQTYALARWSPPAGNEGLFNTALSFQKAEEKLDSSADDHVIRYKSSRDPVEYDVYIRALDAPERIGVVLEFWEGCISREQGQHAAELLETALSQIVSVPFSNVTGLGTV